MTFTLRARRHTDVASTQSQSVAFNVRAAMQRKGKSQAAAGAVLGLSQQAVSRRLVGKVAWDVAELGTLAEFLGVSVASLIRERAA